MNVKLFSLALPVLSAVHAFAADAAPPSASGGILQAMLGLALVVGLIFASGWIMRRLTPNAAGDSPIRVVTAASVGQKERVVLVEINDSWLVLGVAPGQVNLLQTMPKVIASVSAPAAISFIDKLKQAAKRHEHS